MRRICRRRSISRFWSTCTTIDARPSYFRGLRKSLNPGAHVAIIDFRPDSPEGPPPGARVAAGAR